MMDVGVLWGSRRWLGGGAKSFEGAAGTKYERRWEDVGSMVGVEVGRGLSRRWTGRGCFHL